MAMVKAPSGISDRTFVKLRYATIYESTTTTAIGQHLFRGNSIFDPDQTGTGHQPLGYDQWTAFYDKYLVLGSQISVQVINESAGEQCYLGVLPKNEADAVANHDTLAEKPYVRMLYQGVEGSGQAVRRTKLYMSTKKIFGLRRVGTDNTDYTAVNNTNPANVWFWHIYSQSADGNTSVTQRIIVGLKYYVVFFDRKGLSAS